VCLGGGGGALPDGASTAQCTVFSAVLGCDVMAAVFVTRAARAEDVPAVFELVNAAYEVWRCGATLPLVQGPCW
jgi:hypothetical protein